MGGLKMIVFGTEVTFFTHWATWCAEAKRKKSIYDEPQSLGIPRQRVFLITARLSGSVSTPLLKMSAEKEVASSSAAGQRGKDASGEVHAEKSVDKLNVREFCERFCIPNGVSVQLVDGEAVSTEKSADNSIYFTKEQFNAGFRFPLPSLFKEFLHFTQIPPAYIHPNMVRVLMGCSILSMLFNLDLSLLEGAARGHVLAKGLWAGLMVHPDRQFAPNLSLKAPDKDRRGKLVEWVEKASFNRLNRLFEIESYALNILPRRLPKKVVVGEHFVLKDLPFYAEVRKANARARKALLNEWEERRQEGTLRKAPGDKRSAPFPPAGAPVGKKKKIPKKGIVIKSSAPTKGVVIKSPTPMKGIVIRSPAPSGLPSVSSDSVRVPGQNGSGPSMPAAERLALLAEEATSMYQPGSPHPDADVAGASCAEMLPPTAPPMEETGAESQGLPLREPSSLALVPVKGPAAGRSRLARDLKSCISGQLQDCLLETIEVSCSSAQEDHPEGSETKMGEENPTDPVLVPDEGSPEEIQPAMNDGGPDPREKSHHNVSLRGSPVDDAACTSASPFSYAELGEMLKLIPPGSDVALPLAKMFEAAETLVSGIRGMVQQRDIFSDLLQTADYMKAFVSQRMSGEEELRSRLEQVEASLSAARRASEESAEALKKSQDDNEALRIELAEAKRREEATEARLHEAEDETAQLRGEARHLRTEVSIEKKQIEDLQLRLSAQKEELEVEFAAQREELETEYQKQVDEMYFFVYRCCMKKHGIKRDVPSIPPGEEDKLRHKPS
ncbi:uncharacterized protein LOC117931950 [Vitis riparia]|uniref:uncharacterized protein LOC117931950 n=1 Tax=Vitis riparia TaxID=96939 RepID=UPI00155A164D|nr:uncharacterized protein LOC117931950 [Vitis riparia]